MITQEQQNRFQQMDYPELENEFSQACEKENAELIQYLLSDRELPRWVDVDFNSNLATYTAIIMQDKDLVNFLLQSPLLTQHANIYDIFRHAYNLKDEYPNMDPISFLIYECHIPITTELQTFIEQHADLKTFFQCRHLDDSLVVKNISFSKKNKI